MHYSLLELPNTHKVNNKCVSLDHIVWMLILVFTAATKTCSQNKTITMTGDRQAYILTLYIIYSSV